MSGTIDFAGRKIGANAKPVIIAAINSIARTSKQMEETIALFIEAGADVVKGQDCTAETFAVPLSDAQQEGLPYQNQRWVRNTPRSIWRFYNTLLPPSNLN